MYCDSISDAMQMTIDETERRRKIQIKYNEEHGITPKTIIKEIQPPIHMVDDKANIKHKDTGKMTKKETEFQIKQLTKEMNQAAKDLDFEKAAQLRDEILELKATL